MKCKFILIVSIIWIIQSCVASSYKIDDGVYLLKQYTGTAEPNAESYKYGFEKEGSKSCPTGYTIIEKSFKPKALSCAHEILQEGTFFWIIKCKS